MSTAGHISCSTSEISLCEISNGDAVAGWSFYARFYAWRFS